MTRVSSYFRARAGFDAITCGALLLVVSCGVASAADKTRAGTNGTRGTNSTASSPEVEFWQKEYGPTHEKRMKWWREARFGMFIHWGVYSVPGGVWEGTNVTKH